MVIKSSSDHVDLTDRLVASDIEDLVSLLVGRLDLNLAQESRGIGSYFPLGGNVNADFTHKLVKSQLTATLVCVGVVKIDTDLTHHFAELRAFKIAAVDVAGDISDLVTFVGDSFIADVIFVIVIIIIIVVIVVIVT